MVVPFEGRMFTTVMIRCQNCGTDNLDTAQYCDECGAKLDRAPVGQGLPSAPPTRKRAPKMPRSDPAPSPSVQKTLASTESAPVVDAPRAQPVRAAVVVDRPEAPARLMVIRGGELGHEFLLTGAKWLIGRWDPDHGIFPEIDLDAHDPEANVSRRHARLLLQDGQYLIEDLGSTNGTFINRGRRLTPGLRYLVQDGDEIIVGKTFLKFKRG